MANEADTTTQESADEGAGVHRLRDILVEEVSLVDRAANKRRFLVVKRSGKMPEDGKRGRPRKAGRRPGPAAGRGGAEKKPKPGEAVDKARRRAASRGDDEETEKARRSRPPQQDEEDDETEKAQDDDDEEEDDVEAGKADDGKAEDDDEEDDEDDEDDETEKADEDDDDEEDDETEKADEDDDDDEEDDETEKADEDDDDDEEDDDVEAGKADDDDDDDDDEDEAAGPPPPRGGKPAKKAGVAKAGRRMAKDRLNRFQKALELLSDVLKELTAAGKEPAAGGAPDPKRKRAGAPGLGDLVASVGELTNVVKRQQEELVSLRKTRATSNAIAVEGGRRRENQDVSWPLDMNRPISRDTIGKSVSFFDEP